MAEPVRLGDLGQILITQSAQLTYQRWVGCGPAEAQRQLMVFLSQATLRQEGEGDRPALFRYRKRADNVDLSARVARDGDLLSVVSINVRGAPPRKKP